MAEANKGQCAKIQERVILTCSDINMEQFHLKP